MIREQKLVDAILSEGRHDASKIIKKAQKQSQQILDEKTKEEQEFFYTKIEELKNEQNIAFENQKLSQNLIKNKIVLEAKNQILKQVFDLALEKLLNLSKKDYTNFFNKALNHARKDSTLVLANEQDKKFVKKLDAFKSKKLKIADGFGNFSGGVLIVDSLQEIDFSFDSLLKQKFEAKKFELAKQLF